MKKIKIFGTMMLLTIILTGCTNETNSFNDKSITDLNTSTWIQNVENINNQKTIENLKKFNVKEIYLNAGWSFEKNEFYFDKNQSIYNSFIKNLNQSNIKVQALLINDNWALSENYKEMEQQVDKIFEYNKNYENKFSGIHLNIQPYLLDGYMGNKQYYFKSYINNIEKIKNKIDVFNKTYNDHLILSLDIPEWYSLNEFEINNETIADILLNECDELVVMNYTINETDFINNSCNFLKITDKYPEKKIKMAIKAQKSTDLEITSISIYNFTLNQFIHYLKNSKENFKNYNSFKGFAFDDYDSFNSFNN